METGNITEGEFQCFPGSPNQVTFRAKVHDRAQATAREVIYFTEQWITSSNIVTIPVHHARLTINNTCVVLIASFDDPACPGYLTAQPKHTATKAATDNSVATTSQQSITNGSGPTTGQVDVAISQSQSDTGAIVGGTVAVIFIITAGVAIVLISILLPLVILKNGPGTSQALATEQR